MGGGRVGQGRQETLWAGNGYLEEVELVREMWETAVRPGQKLPSAPPLGYLPLSGSADSSSIPSAVRRAREFLTLGQVAVAKSHVFQDPVMASVQRRNLPTMLPFPTPL